MTTATSNQTSRALQLDRLVATYAQLGAEQKRQHKKGTVLRIGRSAAIASAGLFLSIAGVSLLQNLGSVSAPALTTISQSDVDQLVHDRAEFTTKIAKLEQQIGSIQTQKQALELQQAEFVEQTAMLSQLLSEAGTKQTNLEVQQQQGSQLDQEIAAISAQRKALEKRWEQFEAQGELLAMEIIAVNAQRKELESQRRQIDRQRQELAEMLERAEGLSRSNNSNASTAGTEETTGTTAAIADENIFSTYTYDSLVVDTAELDSMRGGFSVGEGLDVAFGFTQTGSVNGVDQFSNSFKIDSVGSGLGNVDMSNMNSVLLQNGSGNIVSSGVLNSLSDTFGNVIQNTLDDQVISTTTVFDISLQNVSGTLQGLHGEQALTDSLGRF